MIEVTCPGCQRTVRLLDSHIGSEKICNNCGQVLSVSSQHSGSESSVAGLIPGDRDSLRMMEVAEQSFAKAIFRQRQAQKVALWCVLIIVTTLLLYLGAAGVKSSTDSNADADVSRTNVVAIKRQEGEDQRSDDALTDDQLPPSTQVFSDVKYYHLNRLCPLLKAVPAMSTLAVALPRGKQPCPKCAPGQPLNMTPVPPAVPEVRQGRVSASEKPPKNIDQKLVFVGQIGEKYHRENCEALHGLLKSMSLSSAQSKGLTACAVCRPPR